VLLAPAEKSGIKPQLTTDLVF